MKLNRRNQKTAFRIVRARRPAMVQHIHDAEMITIPSRMRKDPRTGERVFSCAGEAGLALLEEGRLPLLDVVAVEGLGDEFLGCRMLASVSCMPRRTWP
jgi:hypothetical protein